MIGMVVVEGAEEEEQEGEKTTMRKRRGERRSEKAGEKEGYERRGTEQTAITAALGLCSPALPLRGSL